jgi:aryl-alcohol dehydrogenase-like predicted oxidoreductase
MKGLESTTLTRELGKSGLRVTPMIFGAWAVGGWMWGGADDQQSIDAIRASIDAGVTTIDTAAIYGMGHSETLVGKAIAGYPRDKVIIATKCGMRWDDPDGAGVDPWNQKTPDGRDVVIRKNSRPASIAWEVEQSLKRLNTDYIDLYQIHWPDSSTPFEDSMSAMEKLRKAGKVRAIGVSNYSVDQMKQAMKAGQLASLQPPYSVVRRGIEQEILPFCQKNQIGVIVYSPLERGLLTGKVTPDRKFPPGDHRNEHKLFTVENRRKIIAALESIRPIADRYKANFAQVIINYTMQVPGITAALVGARNVEQARSNAYAMTFTLTPDECQAIRRAFDPLVV